MVMPSLTALLIPFSSFFLGSYRAFTNYLLCIELVYDIANCDESHTFELKARCPNHDLHTEELFTFRAAFKDGS